MSEQHFDVTIIGGGPGGYIAAERLGHAGKKVLLLEKDTLGGTCLNVGCIPTKALLNSAKTLVHAREGAMFGVTVPEATVDWGVMQSWKDQTVKTLVAGVAALQRKNGVTVVKASGRLVAPGRVEADGTPYTSDHVIIATGSEPIMPPIDGVAGNPRVVDSTGLLAVPEIPERLVVIGGGVVGIEFASLFAKLGSHVEVVEMMDEILPFMDADLAAVMRGGMDSITFHLGCRVTSVHDGTVAWTTASGDQVSTRADVVLLSVGRRPLTNGWGAEEAGVDLDRRGVRVDDIMRTNLPNVWAVGDVTGRSLLAHAAYRMGEIAASHILDTTAATKAGQRLRQDTIPWAVYSMPEAAGVGLTEASARARGIDVVTATVPLVLSGRFVAEYGLKAPGTVKLVADRGTRIVRGLHMVGPYAPETIWGAAAVLETELTIDDLRQVVFPHPTVSEGIREAAWALEA